MSTADTSYKKTGGRQTKFASIPEPPADASPALRKWMAAIKETVEVREGKRGNNLDRSIVVRDLFDPYFTDKYWPDGGAANSNLSPGASQKDTTPPGPVTGFSIDATGEASNVLTWTNPTDADLDYIEIYAASIEGIIPYDGEAGYTLDDKVRYAGSVYKVIAIVDPTGSGETRLKNIPPDDAQYGADGSDTHCWMQLQYPYVVVAKAGPKAMLRAVETWTHDVSTGTAAARDWYYWARAVDTAGNKSAWAPDGEGLFALAKTNRLPTPTPTGLCICETGSTTIFNSLDVNLCWSPTTKPGVKDYIMEVVTTATGARRRVSALIRGYRWTYAYSENMADGGGTPEDELTFRLWAQDDWQVKSDGYVEISVSNPPPADVSGITSFQWMNGVQFMWNANTEADLDVYRYQYRIINDPVTPWTDFFEVQSPGVSIFLTEAQRSAYPDGATFEIRVWAVDTWGNVSANAAVDTETTDILHVQPKDIDDFAIDASKMFFKIPVLEGENWSFASLRVSWNQHNVYFNGACYQVAAGYVAVADSSSRAYIYWRTDHKGAGSGTKESPYVSYYRTSTEHPGDAELLGDEGWIIAVNTGTGYDVAWNAIANQVIGSAWIMDAAINNAKIADASITSAKIADLTANLIKAGILQSLYWDTGGGGMQLNVETGDLKIGSSPSDINLEWDNTLKKLTLKGALFQTDGGEYPVPVYRGDWVSGRQYYQADLVVYDGGSWICTQAHTASSTIFPSSEVPGQYYWDVWAAKGEAGDKGDDGDTGPGVTYRGEWLPTTAYVGQTIIRDVVKYLGAFYICQSSHSAPGVSWVPPTSGSGTLSAWSSVVAYPTISPVYCYQVALRFSGATSHIKVEVYYGGSWKTINDQEISADTTHYISVGGTKTITGSRITNYTGVAITITNFQFAHASSGDLPPNESSRWKSFGATFSSVATDLLLANDITVLRSITFGDAATKTGAIHSYGKSTYASSEEGFFIGWEGGVPKVNIGDGDKYMKWTGINLEIGGDVIATGNIQGNAVSQMLVDDDGGVNMPILIIMGGIQTLCSVTMRVDSSDNQAVYLTASATVYSSTSGHRQVFIQWVDQTPGSYPTYYFKVGFSAPRCLFGLYRGGTVLTYSSVDDVTGINPVGYANKSILTALHIKR